MPPLFHWSPHLRKYATHGCATHRRTTTHGPSPLLNLQAQIEDDAAGKSVDLVTNVFREMAGLFPDAVMHVGSDETGKKAPCTMNNTRSFEEKIITFVAGDLKKEVMGWEEILFKTHAAAQDKSVIVDSWERSSWQEAAQEGHRTVASNSGNLYVQYRPSDRRWTRNHDTYAMKTCRHLRTKA